MYLLFVFDDYYPSGGWDDYEGEFKSTEEAREHVLEKLPYRDAYHIVQNQKIVERGRIEWNGSKLVLEIDKNYT